jgi:hypothetical protein
MSDELENTERSRIRQLIQDTVQQTIIGQVQEVFPHTGDEDRPSNHEVTVSSPPGPNPTQTYQRRPVMTPTSGIVTTPKKDDLVLLVFAARSDDPFVIGNIYGDQDADRAPEAAADVIRLVRGNLYIELLGDGSEARIARKPGDTEAPTTQVSVDDAGTISIETDGDVNISAGGEVVIDQGGSAKPVLTRDAVFAYQQRVDTGDGSGGTQTKLTTPVANGEITEADIE